MPDPLTPEEISLRDAWLACNEPTRDNPVVPQLRPEVVARLQGPRRGAPPKYRALILRAVKAGETVAQLHKRTGIPTATIHHNIRQLRVAGELPPAAEDERTRRRRQ